MQLLMGSRSARITGKSEISLVQAMKNSVCPDDAIENHWISRYSKQPEICHAMQNIDGSDFYQNYLLKVWVLLFIV